MVRTVVPLAVLLVVGCGGPTTGTIRGTATYNGVPIAHGSITFTPEGGTGRAVAGPIATGKFEVVNVPVGKVRVEVQGVKALTPTTPELLFPRDTPGNGQVIEVTTGTQERNFSLGNPDGGKGT